MFMKKRWMIAIFLYVGMISAGFAQQEQVKKGQYFWTEEPKLQIVVHIWGEVNSPGQYIVPDGTNVLELISLAGGPTEYSNLNSVKLTRVFFPSEGENSGSDDPTPARVQLRTRTKEIYKVNLNDHLGAKRDEYIPVLKPGDVVKVNRNTWHKFQVLIRVIYQVAIIAQGLYYYAQLFN